MVLVQIGMWNCCTIWNVFTLKHVASWGHCPFGLWSEKKIQDLMKRLDLRSHFNSQIVFHSGVTAMLLGNGKYDAHFRVTDCGSNNGGTNY